MKRGYYLFPLLMASLVACGGSSTGNDGNPPASNPRDGWTIVGNDSYTQKICDGTRLIYEYGDNGITTVENAPECGGESPASPNPYSTP